MMRALAAAAAVLLLAGCSGGGSSGSRAELYDSVAGIVADSVLMVVARVVVQDTDDQPQDTVVSTVEISERFVPTGLGSGLPAGTLLPDKLGSSIQVRQIVEPYLETGQSYLLFLVPSGLPGDAAGQYFPTGSNAGVYTIEGTDFVHGDFTEGDSLPETLTRADLG